MLNELLSPKLYTQLSYSAILTQVEEIRLVVGAPLMTCVSGQKKLFDAVKKEDVEYVLNAVTRDSMYAVNDSLIKGYFSYKGGIRVGVCGEAVVDSDSVKTIKNINGLVIRIPHEKYGVADAVAERLCSDSTVLNTLIIGPPLAGKTTFLRELARLLSTRYLKKVVVIDEKNEISATVKGVSGLNVGYSSVMVGIDRVRGVEASVRNLSPEVVITDELYGDMDRCAVERCIKSGVSVIASMHGTKSDKFESLFDYLVKLSDRPTGKIVEERRI